MKRFEDGYMDEIITAWLNEAGITVASEKSHKMLVCTPLIAEVAPFTESIKKKYAKVPWPMSHN